MGTKRVYSSGTLGFSTGSRPITVLAAAMAAEIIPELVISGIGFFFCTGIYVIVPGAVSNTFPSKDVLIK